MLAHADAESFVAAQLAQLQPYPRYYEHMGPGNTLNLPPMPDVDVRRSTAEQVAERVANGQAQVVDIRPREAVATGHLPGPAQSIGSERLTGTSPVAVRQTTYPPGYHHRRLEGGTNADRRHC